MKSTLNRRSFLRSLGAGASLACLPGLWSVPAQAQPTVSPSVSSYFSQFGIDPALLSRILTEGLSKGAEFCEIFLQHKVSHWVAMEDGEVNRAYTTMELGAGIRVLDGLSTGYAYCEDLSESALLQTASTAASIANSRPRTQPTPLRVRPAINSYPLAIPWTEVGVHQKTAILEQAQRAALTRDRRIVKVAVSLSDETSQVLIANSEGLYIEDHQPMASLHVSCVAEHNGHTESSSQSTAARESIRHFRPELIEQVASQGADYTTLLFDAAPAPSGQLPVVLGPGNPGIILHEAIGHGLEADFCRKGQSVYGAMTGQRVAPPGITIIDEGHGRGRGSIAIDDEGTAAQSTTLVEDGVLCGFLHDRLSAKHFAVASTGSARRESYRYPPVPRMRNTYLAAGSQSPEEIIASVDRGLYAEVVSSGQVAIGAGDFTFYVKHGRLIEKGKLTRVIKDVNLTGNGPRVLQRVSMIGSDLEHHSGAGLCDKDEQQVPVGFGMPTIKIDSLLVGGRHL